MIEISSKTTKKIVQIKSSGDLFMACLLLPASGESGYDVLDSKIYATQDGALRWALKILNDEKAKLIKS